MNKSKFVTANYTNLYNTKLNGRLNRDFGYMYSLAGIAQCGDTIINYTCPYNIQFTESFFKQLNITNIINIDYDLTSSPYHERVDKIKDLHPRYDGSSDQCDTSWKNRCVEIMFGKFLWLEENFNKLENDDYLFWIDAGLSHGGVIPRKFNTFHKNLNYYRQDKSDLLLEYAHRHDTIFNKDFTRKLEKYTGDKILLLGISHSQHGDPLGFSFHNNFEQWPIGGLFGGQKKVMLPFINRFKEIAQQILDNNLLVKEEQIMTVIHSDTPEWFKTFTFQTWYHDDWDVYNKNMISFSDFFTELIKCT